MVRQGERKDYKAMYVIVETLRFTAKREETFGDEENYREFQISLIENPTAGSVIPGCGGVRKVRWGNPKQGKGKSGGIRVIYLFVEEFDVFLLLLAYTKNRSENLTPEQQKAVRELAEVFREELERNASEEQNQ